MNAYSLPPALTGLLSDLSNPAIVWQFGALLLCSVLGWAVARMVQGVFSVTERPIMVSLSTDSFVRVLVPALSLFFVYVGMHVLAGWHNVYLLRLAIPIFIAVALIRFAFYLLYPVISRAQGNARLLRRLEKTFNVMVWIWSALYLTGLWPSLLYLLDNISIEIGTRNMSLLWLLKGAASVVVTVLVALWLSALLERRLMHIEGVGASVRLMLSRLLRAILIVGALLVSLSLVGLDLTVLSVFGGALGVGLGLGLQRIASNYVSGFLILLERSLNIGDLITVAAYSGRVTRINTRYTVLQGLDGVESLIPNEMLVSTPVQNHSLSDRSVLLSTDIVISYQNDLDLARKVLENAAAGAERVSAEKPPKALLMKFGPDGFEFRVSFWISDVEKGNSGVISAVNLAIWQALQNNGIRSPFVKDAAPEATAQPNA
jgi:small-conductance mechanosensitive channel